MVILNFFKDKILSKYAPKRTKLHPNPPSKAHGLVMQISKSEKKIIALATPLIRDCSQSLLRNHLHVLLLIFIMLPRVLRVFATYFKIVL